MNHNKKSRVSVKPQYIQTTKYSFRMRSLVRGILLGIHTIHNVTSYIRKLCSKRMYEIRCKFDWCPHASKSKGCEALLFI